MPVKHTGTPVAEAKPPPLLVAATVEVLRPHAPFDAMAPADLEFLASRLRVRYFAAGARILGPEDGRVELLYIVQRGQVSAAAPTPHADSFPLIEGECFPIGALLGSRPTTLVYSARGDTFCYVLDAADFHALLAASRVFEMFCTRRLAHLLEQSTRATRESFARRAVVELGLASPLRSALRRAAVTLPQTASIRDALELMKARRIGSVVLTDDSGRPAGIFTQTDVLDRVALAERPLATPIAEVMTRDPAALPATSTLAEAADTMARAGFRHLLVMEDDALAGVISERDLFALQRRSMQGLRKEIASADSVEALAFAAREVRGLAGTLLAQGTAAEALMRLVTTLNDAIASRAVELSLARHDVGGIAFCWIGLGSEGRMEQTLATDQDNAIVFDDGGDRDGTRARLVAFARDVNATLDACGYPFCKGEIMAGNARWCLSLAEWRQCFDGWMRNAVPSALLNAAIFFDLRPLWGEARLAHELRAFITAEGALRPAFLRHMADNALLARPLNLLGDFVVDDERLDLKLHASRPFVDAARILSLASGVDATSTVERLRLAGTRQRMDGADIGAAIDAFLFVQVVRLRDGNRVRPGDLNALDQRILKEALRQARKLQNRLALDYQL
jgi:CBS domain-containing protein